MKPSRSAVSISVALALVALGVAFVSRPRPHAVDGRFASPAAPADPPVRLAWKKGEAYVYRFSWENETAVRSPELVKDGANDVQGSVAFEGELTLRCVDDRDGAYRLAARIDAPTKHHVAVFGKEALADDADAKRAFDGREALVEMDARGGVRSIAFAREAPTTFRYTMRGLLQQLHVTMPTDDAPAWRATEPGPAGRADVAWTRTSATSYERTRATYGAFTSLSAELAGEHHDELESRSTLELAPEGFVRSLRDAEILSVREAKGGAMLLRERAAFALQHVRTVRDDAAPMDTSHLVAWHPGDAEAPTASTEEQALTQLAATMSVKTIGQQMFLAGIGRPVAADFLARAVALLRLHPGDAAELLRIATAREMPPRGRELAADVLAAAGNDESQAALRSLVEAPTVRGDAVQHRHVLQRIGFVASPRPETVAVARSAYLSATSRGDTDGRLAAAYTLGSAAAHLAKRGSDTAARAIVDELARDLASTKHASDRLGLIAALGNAGLESALPTLRAQAEDEDADVRAETAHALRKVETPEARDLLYGMAGDPDGDVARNAIDSLGEQPLADADVSRLAQLTTSGAVPHGGVPTLLTVLSKHTSPAADVEAALRALAARYPGDTATQGRIDAILSQLHPEPLGG